MTCETLGDGRWRLAFPEAEALFFVNVLARLREHYAQDLSSLPPSQRTYWKETRSPELTAPVARDAAKEEENVLGDARAELRSQRLVLAENWLQDFELADSRDPWTVELADGDRDEFVAMLNDRRLLLALEIGLNEADLERGPQIFRADNPRTAALLEIDLLGHFIMVILGPQTYRA
jgi:hypothetical protein